MRKQFGLVMAGIFILAFAATAHGEEDYRGRWWRIPQMAQRLQLSEAETRQLEAAYEKALVQMIDLRSKVEVEQVKLRRLLEMQNFDEAAVLEQHRREEEARSRLAQGRFAFLLEVRKIVGRDRFIKLLDFRDQKKREFFQQRLQKNKP